LTANRWRSIRLLNRKRCRKGFYFGSEMISLVRKLGDSEHDPIGTVVPSMFHSSHERLQAMKPVLDRFAVTTPVAVAKDMPGLCLPNQLQHTEELHHPDFDTLHPLAVKLQIAFPDRSLLQHDCGKLQVLHDLLKGLKAGGHRVLIFTQMTRMLDILEIFLSHNGHHYSRLDGSTKVEDRLLVTERFNASPKIFALIASTRSGGVGIK
jgi:helicase SWR1